MAETETTRLIGIAIPTLRELRGATLASLSAGAAGEADAVDVLREAGYAGGGAVYEAFEQWLREMESSAAPDLPLEEFGDRAARYFRAAGWGRVKFQGDPNENVASLAIENCWEADGSDGETPSCHVTTGMLAAFFGRLAGYPVSVMESECSSMGAARCLFLLGNSEVMMSKWEELQSRPT
jgi:predicted hydrocarbon binding protein